MPGDWRPGNYGLVDAAGNGIYLDSYVGDTYVQIGAGTTTDSAVTGSGVSFADVTADASVGVTIKYVVNLDTGQVDGYIDASLEHTATVDLTGVGPITHVVLQAKKFWALDNLILQSE